MVKKKERPVFLSVWLILMIVAVALSFFLMAFLSIFNLLTPFLQWYMIISLILEIFFIYLLYNWKIVGFYGMVILSLVAFALNISRGTNVVTCVLGLVGVFVLYLAMKPVWKNFN